MVAGDGIGHAATRAFSLLGTEIRLGILLAVWAAYEPFGEDDALVKYTCSVCKRAGSAVVVVEAVDHPVVVSFFHDRGIDVRLDTRYHDSYRGHWELLVASEEQLASNDPVRIELMFSPADEDLRLVLDGDLEVIEGERLVA